MKTYRVEVEKGEDGWLVGQSTDLPSAISQGRDLDELAVMMRDAIETLTSETDFGIDLVLPPGLPLSGAA